MKLLKIIKSVDKKIYLIFVFALFIRLAGLTYGLPLILNLDEPSLVSTTLQLNNNGMQPNRFDWPHLHFYINFLFYSLFFGIRKIIELVGLKGSFENVFPLIWQSPAIFVLISRFINATLGSLTVFPVFYFAKKVLKKKNLALLAALMFAILPVHVIDSHQALLDTAMTFWLSIFLFYVYDLNIKDSFKKFAIAGLLLGLGVSTKYTALLYGLVYATFLVANTKLQISTSVSITVTSLKKVFLKFLNLKVILKNIVFILSIIGTYLVTNFTVLLNPKLFWSDAYGTGFLFQIDNVGEKTSLEYPLSLFENFYTQAVGDYGVSLYLVISFLFISFLFFGYRKRVLTKLLILPIFFYLYISAKDRNPSHYFIFIYPLLSVAVVYFLSELSKICSKKLRVPYVAVFSAFFAFTILSPLYKSFNYTYKTVLGDTRVDLYKWVVNKSDDFPVFYYGEDLNLVSFDKNITYERIKLVDFGYLKSESEIVYLVIGQSGVTKSDLLDPDSDILEINGGEKDVLVNSTLEQSFDNEKKLGPPIYVFKVKNN